MGGIHTAYDKFMPYEIFAKVQHDDVNTINSIITRIRQINRNIVYLILE